MDDVVIFPISLEQLFWNVVPQLYAVVNDIHRLFVPTLNLWHSGTDQGSLPLMMYVGGVVCNDTTTSQQTMSSVEIAWMTVNNQGSFFEQLL